MNGNKITEECLGIETKGFHSWYTPLGSIFLFWTQRNA